MNTQIKEWIKKDKFYYIDIDLGCIILLVLIAIIPIVFHIFNSLPIYISSLIDTSLPYILILAYITAIIFEIGIFIDSIKRIQNIKEHLFFYRLSKNKKAFLFLIITIILILLNLISHSFDDGILYSMDDNIFYYAILVLDIFYFIYLAQKIATYQSISKAITEIANGNIEYKMEQLDPSLPEIAKQLNHISNGLSQALEEKLKSERLKTDLVANISHDLRTPLTSIINYIGLLQKQKPKDKKTNQYLKVLETKSQKLKNLTDDLISISKITSGNEPLHLGQTNFSEMVLQANGEFAEKFEKKQLHLINTIESPEITLYIDSRKMGRVLENIYSNIYKYALDNTRVYIELKQLENHILFTTKNISKDKLNISADELMERFVRGDTSRNTVGNGLGLAISKSLVELHEGTFELFIEGDLFMTKLTLPTILSYK